MRCVAVLLTCRGGDAAHFAGVIVVISSCCRSDDGALRLAVCLARIEAGDVIDEDAAAVVV